jgi:Protein of unknown function (DUF2799)
MEAAMSHCLHRVVVLTLCAFAAGCVSMSEQQCRTTNWYQRGETDGITGLQAKIDQYADQCRRFGVQPAEQDYLAGWAWGYSEYGIRVSGARM